MRNKQAIWDAQKEELAPGESKEVEIILKWINNESNFGEKKNVAEVILAKHRGGSTGTVDLAWLPSYTKFANLDRRFFEEP